MSNATRGETANYYNSGPEAQDDRRGYGAQPAVGQAQYNGQQAPQDLGEKRTFDQTFKIEKPKWNDLWAGVLVSAELSLSLL